MRKVVSYDQVDQTHFSVGATSNSSRRRSADSQRIDSNQKQQSPCLEYVQIPTEANPIRDDGLSRCSGIRRKNDGINNTRTLEKRKKELSNATDLVESGAMVACPVP